MGLRSYKHVISYFSHVPENSRYEEYQRVLEERDCLSCGLLSAPQYYCWLGLVGFADGYSLIAVIDALAIAQANVKLIDDSKLERGNWSSTTTGWIPIDTVMYVVPAACQDHNSLGFASGKTPSDCRDLISSTFLFPPIAEFIGVGFGKTHFAFRERQCL